MAISNSIGSNFGQADIQQPRRLDTEQKIREATLASAQGLSSAEIQAHQNFYNKAVDVVDGVRNGNVGDCVKLDPQLWERLFPGRSDDKRVENATAPHLFDNGKARDLRSDYQGTYREARRDRARAEREAQRLGPGDHVLANGDRVNVKEYPGSGKKVVTTTRADGSTRTVTFDDSHPNSVDVKITNPDGSSYQLRQDETSVSRSSRGPDGETSTDAFSLDQNGNPVKESTGPAEGECERTTAAEDGSTDTRTVSRDEGGRTVDQDRHELPGWHFLQPPLDPFHAILPQPWWRARNADDDFDRGSIKGLVPLSADGVSDG